MTTAIPSPASLPVTADDFRADSAHTLPVLDLSRLDGGGQEARAFRDDLREATHEYGFFYLTGHGVDPELERRVHETVRAFFALPEEDKLAIENTLSPQFRGYTRIGKELTRGAVDWREQIDVGPELPEDRRRWSEADYWRLHGPNLWPEALPGLREVLEAWTARLSETSLRLLRAWAEALGAAPDVFDEAFAHDPLALLKVVRYPGLSNPEPKQGVGAHRDGGVLTLLWVEPGKGGLQVEHDGAWIDAPPVPGAFVVNIGEMLEYATGGYLKATVHRVVSPPLGEDRVSIPFFYNPALDARVPELRLPEELRAQAAGLSVDPDDSPILRVYGDNALRYRLRAHPNVAEIHHADLLTRSAAS